MKKILVVCLVSILAGCSVNKELRSIDGSKSDAIIEMGYTYGGFEKPIVNWDGGLSKARVLCQNWGFKDAEKFDVAYKSCQFYTSGGHCGELMTKVKYQCTVK
ncbi:MAG TPA: hypothetical protein DCL21_04130 [Alphaproteobacteria bacterium]|nr:hypothetical protein [Alphaproteobacteria bacterium]